MDQLVWMDELRNLIWAVQALASMHSPGSYEKEIASNAAKGIKTRIEWVMEQAAAELAALKKK
jgi:hypothetical protein